MTPGTVVLACGNGGMLPSGAARGLRLEGHRVLTLRPHPGLVTTCVKQAPEVLLLDVRSLGRRALPIVDALQAHALLQVVPIILLGRREEQPAMMEALRRGAHDCLRQPFRACDLVARVRAARRTRALVDGLTRRNAELADLAITDGLTGLYNRRFMDQALHHLVTGARRHGRPFAALLLDVDHFKQINDAHGHCAGDALLRELAERLRRRLRTVDLLGRWGGEEFLVLAPETDGAGARRLGESLRRVVEECAFLDDVRVTISVGHACWQGEGESALIGRADARLYAVKTHGRNGVAGDLDA